MFSSGRQREPRGLGINMLWSAILIFHVETQYSASQNEVTVRRWRDDSERPAKKKKTFETNIYRIYPCISRPFMASKEAPKIALDLYMGHIIAF